MFNINQDFGMTYLFTRTVKKKILVVNLPVWCISSHW